MPSTNPVPGELFCKGDACATCWLRRDARCAVEQELSTWKLWNGPAQILPLEVSPA